MKLIENRKVKLFEEGIKGDSNLPKFSTIKKAADPKFADDPDASIEVVEGGDVNGPILFQSSEKIKGEIITLDDLPELLGSSAHLLNIRLSKYLYKRMENIRWLMNDQSEEKPAPKVSFWKRIFKDKEESEKEYELDISGIFKEIKLVSTQKDKLVKRITEYLSLIEKATKMGQEAQKEKLLSEFTNHLYECILYSIDLCNFITEEQLINLQNKCSRQLDLDYVKNFTRIIPDEVVEIKEQIDKLEIFDNYVILHYNPDGASVAPTQREIKEEYERKRDPILFGVIQGSRKLYYIADWVDEFCDLTWSEVVKKLGEQGVGKIEPKIVL